MIKYRTKSVLILSCVLSVLSLVFPTLSFSQPQQFSSLGDYLFSVGCTQVRVCRDIPGNNTLCDQRVTTVFNPSIPFNPSNPWPRYGHPFSPQWPLSISDGILHGGWTQVKDICTRSDNPCNLRKPYTWTVVDEWDASKTWTASRPCREMIVERFTNSGGSNGDGNGNSNDNQPCDTTTGWVCGNQLPSAIITGCNSELLLCEITNPPTPGGCYLENRFKIRGRTYIQISPKCDWRLQPVVDPPVEPPVDPPVEPPINPPVNLPVIDPPVNNSNSNPLPLTVSDCGLLWEIVRVVQRVCPR